LGAACLADSLWYVMGTTQHVRLISKIIPKQFQKQAASIAKILARGMLGGLLTVKFSPVPSSIVPFLAGSARFSVGRFLFLQVIANLVWGAVFLFGGFLIANSSLPALGNFMRLLSSP
jgi:membrane protein DedA with SNARE-associated domain